MGIADVYIELDEIKKTEYKRITVVKSEIDHLLYIKKEYNDNHYSLYQQIKNMNSNYFPHIEMVYQEEERTIVIEQYINASTLDIYLYNHNVNKNEAINIFNQICQAIINLHNLKPPVIHRDIKPENIFYDHGQIYLFDFDISRYYDENKSKDTRVLGSVGYASPEQFGFQQSDQRSDIYALGVLLNVLLTKQMPNTYLYSGDERKVIEKAIKIDPDQRYQKVEDLLQDLQSSKSQFNFISLIRDIPGFHNDSLLIKLLSLLGYSFIIAISFSTTVEGYSNNSIVTWLNRIAILIMFLSLIFVIGNFQQIQSRCLFATSQNKWIKYIGILISYCLFVFLEIFVLAIILSFF